MGRKTRDDLIAEDNARLQSWEDATEGMVLQYTGDVPERGPDRLRLQGELTFVKLHSLTATVRFENEDGTVTQIDGRKYDIDEFEIVSED